MKKSPIKKPNFSGSSFMQNLIAGIRQKRQLATQPKEPKQMTELKPCPHCGGDMTEIVLNETYNYVVRCHDCYASGPPAAERHDACAFWGIRSAQGQSLSTWQTLSHASAQNKPERAKMEQPLNETLFA